MNGSIKPPIEAVDRVKIQMVLKPHIAHLRGNKQVFDKSIDVIVWWVISGEVSGHRLLLKMEKRHK